MSSKRHCLESNICVLSTYVLLHIVCSWDGRWYGYIFQTDPTIEVPNSFRHCYVILTFGCKWPLEPFRLNDEFCHNTVQHLPDQRRLTQNLGSSSSFRSKKGVLAEILIHDTVFECLGIFVWLPAACATPLVNPDLRVANCHLTLAAYDYRPPNRVLCPPWPFWLSVS